VRGSDAGPGSITSTGVDPLLPVFGALFIVLGGLALLVIARRRAAGE
jgi:hypothetical protein